MGQGMICRVSGWWLARQGRAATANSLASGGGCLLVMACLGNGSAPLAFRPLYLQVICAVNLFGLGAIEFCI